MWELVASIWMFKTESTAIVGNADRPSCQPSCKQPSQAQVDVSTTTLADLRGPGSFIPDVRQRRFHSNIVADSPNGYSIYHGLQTPTQSALQQRSDVPGAYTYSRTIDNSTADFFTTSLTPRRPQDFQNWDAERSVSPLSRTHRFTLAAVYDLPYFKTRQLAHEEHRRQLGLQPGLHLRVSAVGDGAIGSGFQPERRLCRGPGILQPRRRDGDGKRSHSVAQHRRGRHGGLPRQQSQCPVHRRGPWRLGDQWPQHSGHPADQ